MDEKKEELMEHMNKQLNKRGYVCEQSDDQWIDSPKHVNNVIRSQKKDEESVLMMDANLVMNCMDCKKGFNLIVKKHHCKYCGKIFCGQCLSLRVNYHGENESWKICMTCAQQMLKPSTQNHENDNSKNESVNAASVSISETKEQCDDEQKCKEEVVFETPSAIKRRNHRPPLKSFTASKQTAATIATSTPATSFPRKSSNTISRRASSNDVENLNTSRYNSYVNNSRNLFPPGDKFSHSDDDTLGSSKTKTIKVYKEIISTPNKTSTSQNSTIKNGSKKIISMKPLNEIELLPNVSVISGVNDTSDDCAHGDNDNLSQTPSCKYDLIIENINGVLFIEEIERKENDNVTNSSTATPMVSSNSRPTSSSKNQGSSQTNKSSKKYPKIQDEVKAVSMEGFWCWFHFVISILLILILTIATFTVISELRLARSNLITATNLERNLVTEVNNQDESSSQLSGEQPLQNAFEDIYVDIVFQDNRGNDDESGSDLYIVDSNKLIYRRRSLLYLDVNNNREEVINPSCTSDPDCNDNSREYNNEEENK